MDRRTFEVNARIRIAAMLEQLNPPRLYAICTGACAGLQRTLWSVPGISALLVGAEFPYANEATAEVLGFTPESYVAAETAMAMAHTAYMKAIASLRVGQAIGLGVTGSVASTRPHRGDHRAWVAVVTATTTLLRHVILPKGIGTDAREADDTAIEIAALNAVIEVQAPIAALGYIPDPGHGTVDVSIVPEKISQRVFFARPYFRFDGTREATPESQDMLLYPGAFDPPHHGHHGLAFEAARIAGKRTTFHITSVSPHKPALTVPEMLTRARALRGHDVLFSLDRALYIEKARQHPGAGIVIGADALVRMLDPRWCPVDPMLDEFAALNTRFYVAGRLIGDRYTTLDDIDVPPAFAPLCEAVPGRWDVSSSALRARASA